MITKQHVDIYTDGACSMNPGPGGWGALLNYGRAEEELSGSSEHTTNNKMELLAAISALESLSVTSSVSLTTDSTYVKDGITKWIFNWKKRNWKNSTGKPVKNIELWKRLDEVSAKHKVSWYWVKGHTGHVENERADQLATDAIKNMQNKEINSYGK